MFYVAVVAFATGVGIATLLPVSLAVIAWLFVLGSVVAVVRHRNSLDRSSPHLLLVAVTLFSGSLGLLRTEWHEEQYGNSVLNAHIGSEYAFSGIVTREPDVRERTTHLYVESGEDTILLFSDRYIEIKYGDEVFVRGEVGIPRSFETEFGRQFDYAGYLLARDVEFTISYPEITVLSSGNSNLVIAALLDFKHTLMAGIAMVIPEPQAGLADGLLLGVKQALGDTLETAFRQSGIIHIVVLSGYNVMLVVAFFKFFLQPLPRRLQVILGLATILGFALLVGLSATVVRASIMAGLVLIAGYFSRQYDVLRALCLAGVLMLLINPYLLLYDIGFQLSFMATLGLILVAPRLETAIIEGQWFGVKEFFIATLATQIAVLPLLMYHIGEVSIVAVAVNMLVLPIVPFAMLGAFISGVIALLMPIVALPFAFITNGLLALIISIAIYSAALPFATVTLPAFSAVWVLVGYGLIALILTKHWRKLFHKDEFDNWEIVEEIAVTSSESKPEEKETGQKPVSQSDVPIFFR